ncbi:transcriptional regulator [Methanolobus sp. ZRKC3]|uniref:transcriptional regulator n=1 Tax=Methanolobus sp. ZRKC3 TaxID=3125786 RepID=UPI0032555DE7
MSEENDILVQILQNLKEINSKLDRITVQTEPVAPKSGQFDFADSMDVMTLLSLPDHLRTTATTLFEIGPATAEEISVVTKKERAVESNYLNQLVRMDHVEKFRNGRKVYFQIKEKM